MNLPKRRHNLKSTKGVQVQTQVPIRGAKVNVVMFDEDPYLPPDLLKSFPTFPIRPIPSTPR